MPMRKTLLSSLLVVLLVCPSALQSAEVSIEGAPIDSGFNVGSLATIRATVKGLAGEASRYAVFAEIQYAGTTSTTSVQMDLVKDIPPDAATYEIGWPIPPQAPSGIYTVTVQVEDRTERRTVATQKLRSFGAYKKLLEISHLAIDRTFYNVGEPIRCQLTIRNLSGQEMRGLRVEFSNANYPWIALYSKDPQENLDLALKVLRSDLSIPAHGEAAIPMMDAGTATFMQGKQQEVMGAGAPVRHEKNPPPEVDTYTVAVWNAERTVLYDMQFTTPAIVRPLDRTWPKPYSLNYTHPYNSDIDFAGYREFYPPGMISPAIKVDQTRTLYRPGDSVKLNATLKNPGTEAWSGAELRATFLDSSGRQVHAATVASGINLAPGQTQALSAEAWKIPATQAPGTYAVKLTLEAAGGQPLASTQTEIAVNHLPPSVLVFCPHEDDEHAYAGLIRAAVEAGIPIRVVILTGGDVGECERYYDKPCGPNEAREFGMVRMEEAAEALEHLGLTRDKLSILGLPDGGSGEIWFRHIKPANPFLDVYLATDHSPYDNVLKPNLPFARDSVVETLKQIITDFHPALIATPHPDERHVDHRTTNWFVIKACQELVHDKRLDPATIVWADQAYGSGGFRPAPYKYEKAVVYLSGEVAMLKQEMGWIYQSQDGNLAEGMKQAYERLPRQEDHLRIMDWQQHAGWNEQP